MTAPCACARPRSTPKPGTLSGGNQQKVALAKCAANPPAPAAAGRTDARHRRRRQTGNLPIGGRMDGAGHRHFAHHFGNARIIDVERPRRRAAPGRGHGRIFPRRRPRRKKSSPPPWANRLRMKSSAGNHFWAARPDARCWRWSWCWRRARCSTPTARFSKSARIATRCGRPRSMACWPAA